MKVIFACAGTGGHVNPAIAIARIILEHKKDIEILFIGTENGLENKLVKNAGFNIKHISTGKLLRSFTLKNFTAIYKTYKGILEAKKIIMDEKPDLIIGTGGYICGPVCVAAKKLKIPYILHESNAFPGLSVKLLAKNAYKVMLGFDEAKPRLKNRKNLVYTGTPAKFNEKMYLKLDKNESKEKFKLDNIKKKLVLVTCGSQGAKKVNETVVDLIENIQSEKYHIVLVTGDKNYDEINDKLNKIKLEKNIDINKFITLKKFVYQMDEMYNAVDMCVTRGGAMTITELLITKKPAIVIPLPTAAENHQYYNAKILEDLKLGKIIEQKDLNYQVLDSKINEILNNIETLSTNIDFSKALNNDVEEKIYSCIESVIK